MGKKGKQTTGAPAPKKSASMSTTLARKGKKVLQSNGLHYFKSWAEKTTTGGKRRKAGRPAFKMEHPKLYKQLVAKGEAMNRRMDRPPEPKEEQ